MNRPRVVLLVLLGACSPEPGEIAAGGPDERGALPPTGTSATGTGTGSGETWSGPVGHPELPDASCLWSATVAAGQDVTIEASLDGNDVRPMGIAGALIFGTDEALARCETGPVFDTDELAHGDEAARFGFGEPAFVEGSQLVDGGAVHLMFFEPGAAVALLLPSSESSVTSVSFAYTSEELNLP